MALSAADPIPRLSDACDPPAVIGAAALTTAAFQGATADALAGMIERLDTDPIARLHDTSIAYQLAFRRAEALGLQAEALAGSQLFRIRRESRSPADIRLLALMAPGDLMVNTPLDFITNYLDVRLDLLFLMPDRGLPAIIPDHDVMFFAVSEVRCRHARPHEPTVHVVATAGVERSEFPARPGARHTGQVAGRRSRYLQPIDRRGRPR